MSAPLPTWITDVLDAALPQLVGAERDAAARAVLAAIPRHLVNTAARESIAATLKWRGIRDGAGDVAFEMARNVTDTVMTMLRLGEHAGDEADDITEPTAGARTC